MTVIPVPLFLQRDKARKLNEQLVEKTGCFAFLRTSHILLAENPSSYCDAFTIYAIGLYVLYHDYGCRFLNLLLDEVQQNPVGLDTRCIHALSMHLKIILNSIRPNIAHGVFQREQREEMQHQIANYYLQSKDRSFPEEWDDFTGCLTESDWETITRRLVRDTDKLHVFLEKWSDAWAGQSDDSKDELRKRFGKSMNFARSFDKRICADILSGLGVKTQSFSWSKLPRWQNAVSQAFINGEVTTPDEIYTKLHSVIHSEISPPTPTSSTLADKHGFGIPTI